MKMLMAFGTEFSEGGESAQIAGEFKVMTAIRLSHFRLPYSIRFRIVAEP
jgi:hypothetical protein